LGVGSARNDVKTGFSVSSAGKPIYAILPRPAGAGLLSCNQNGQGEPNAMSDQDGLKKSKKAWEDGPVAKVVGRFPERCETFKTTSDIEIERLYTPLENEGLDYEKDLGFPGQYPFTRGVQPTMFRGRFWTMRQYSGFGSAEDTNKRFRYLLEQGQTGLSVAFDLPTQMGYDSDHPMSSGEVGKVGVAIDSIEDMEVLFDQIPLGKVTTSMTINSTAAILLTMYLALAKKQGLDWDKIGGTIQNDVLKEYMARGTYIYPPEQSMRIISDVFDFCTRKVPRWNVISISGYHIREAGCTAVQEVAFTLADGIAYVDAAIKTGLDVDAFAGRLSFFFNAHNNFLEEVAKYRAARRLWARIMKERFGAKNPKSMMLRFHTQTAGSSLTAQQPENNVVRVAYQALAAALGGTQSLHTNSLDEALALPSDRAVTIALRTQQIIANETGVADTPDPLAGSYLIESLTDQIEAKARDYLDRIDEKGGMVAAIMEGFPQREIQDAAYKYQKAVDAGRQVVVGVNKFQQEELPLADVLRVDPEVGRMQQAKLAALRDKRDNAKVEALLAALAESAKGNDNLVERIYDCVENLATLGEISDTLRKVFGEFEEVLVV
jgi:methylmalonyl-CoA mutase, N-terminal domain